VPTPAPYGRRASKKLHFYVKFREKAIKRQKNSCFYGVKQQKSLKKDAFSAPKQAKYLLRERQWRSVYELRS